MKNNLDKNIKITKKKIFNKDGSDELQNSDILRNQNTNIINVLDSKYPWIEDFYYVLTGNMWFPEKVDLSGDYIKDLNHKEYQAFKNVLSALTAQDSIQANILGEPTYDNFLNDSGIAQIFAILRFQEVIHARSYSTMALTFITNEKERHELFYKWQNNQCFKDKLSNIAEHYQNFTSNPCLETMYLSVINSLVLESILFYSGFYFFYNFMYSNVLNGVADMIKLIHRDEYSHFLWFMKIKNILDTEYSKEIKNIYHLNKKIDKIFTDAINFETNWFKELIGDSIRNFSIGDMENFIKFLCDQRRSVIGLKKLYPGVKNPIKFLTDIISVEKDDSLNKIGFFESNVTSYNHPTVIKDWSSLDK